MSASWSRTLVILALAACSVAQPPAKAQQDASPVAAKPVVLTDDDAAAIGSALRGVEDQGFAPGEFDRGDAAAAAIAYAKAQHGGRVPVSSFPRSWALHPAAYDASADFASAVSQHRLGDWLAALPQSDPRYGKLVQAYARYRRIAAQGGWATVKAIASKRSGEVLRARLALEDPAATDGDLAEAISRAQVRYGITPDGALNAATVDALNEPVDRRLAQIRATLERWRWMPRSLPSTRVELNIASASLVYYEGGAAALTMRAVVGKPDKQTPTLSDEIDSIVLNPPWNVPPEIAAREIRPKGRDYMRRHGFVVRAGGGLQQRPGPHSSLGTIKFNLANPYDIYLHDTPEKALFSRDDRALSHGCMRLEKPNELAQRLLSSDPDWTESRLDEAISTGKTRRVDLPQAVPVYVVYWTAFVDDDGQVSFRSDAYGWDEKLLGLLPAVAG